MFARTALCVLFLTTVARAEPLTVRTGDWTWTETIRVPGRPSVVSSSRRCMTKALLASGYQGPLSMGKAACHVTKEVRTAHAASYELACHTDQAIEGTTSFELQVTS